MTVLMNVPEFKRKDDVISLLLVAALIMVFALTACEKDIDKGPVGNTQIIKTEIIYPGIEKVTIISNELGATKKFVVVLPDGYYASEKKWPVVYIFHGKGCSENTLVDIESVRDYFLSSPFFIIMPDGDNSWYINSPVNANSEYESYISEVMQIAESNYRISDDPDCRGLIGWSMGGYGVIRYAERHKEEFNSVASIIGVIDYPSLGRGRDVVENGEDEIFGVDQETWDNFNPINDVEALSKKNILLIAGSNDNMTKDMNANFDAKLNDLTIDHQYVVIQGGHDFNMVINDAIPVALSDMKDWLKPKHIYCLSDE
jgi:S-formylglutathione hydrolase FrmB